MIEAREAHILWNPATGVALVCQFESEDDKRVDLGEGGWLEAGANDYAWRDEIDDDWRVLQMMEYAIELMSCGSFDPATVLWEFSRVKQFRDMAEQSGAMRRAIERADARVLRPFKDRERRPGS